MNETQLTEYLDTLDATDAQRAEIREVAATLARVYIDGPALWDALGAAAQVIQGDNVTAQLVEAWKTANRAVAAANILMRGALAAEVMHSSELAVAQRYQISRPTVRKAVGK